MAKRIFDNRLRTSLGAVALGLGVSTVLNFAGLQGPRPWVVGGGLVLGLVIFLTDKTEPSSDEGLGGDPAS